ncbi:MAG: O-phosphoserine--tRNA ligase [Candidatus Altiarchaeota archaeon]
MAFDTRRIKGDAKKNFRKTWLESAKLVPEKTKVAYSLGKGKPHPVQDLIQKVRKVFLDMGFEEVENPLFVSEEDVYKQYGPEAAVILDRVYYLAGLPRPDIGLSDEQINQVKILQSEMLDKRASGLATSAPAHFVEKDLLKKILQDFFRDYREGKIEGDNFLEEAVSRLEVDTDTAIMILELFPEFKNLKPVPSKQTLRSHMTGAWFPTIAALIGKRELPLLLFSIGLRFRREQRVDSTHLRAHYGASMVVVDDRISVEAGKKLTEEILKRLDFTDIRYVKKKATSNYYAPDTEYEVYSGDIEVADIGMYSPVALAQYDIPVNVFNLGFGLERFIMAKEKRADVRELLYPQFYEVVDLSDREIAEQIEIDQKPSKENQQVVTALVDKAREIADKSAPLWEKVPTIDSMTINGKRHVPYKFSVEVGEKEAGKNILGPAALNRIYVYNGEIIAVPPKDSPKRKKGEKLDKELTEIEKNGIDTKITILDAISNRFISEIEKKISKGITGGEVLVVGMARSASDVNIKIGEPARRFIESKNKRIFIKGPVFMNVRYDVLSIQGG